MADLGKTPHVMHFAEGDYVIDASRQYYDGPSDDASGALAKYEDEIAKKKAEREAKFKKKDMSGISDEDVADVAQYLNDIEV